MRWANEQEDISFSPYKDEFLKEHKRMAREIKIGQFFARPPEHRTP